MTSLSERIAPTSEPSITIDGVSPTVLAKKDDDQPRPATQFWASARRPKVSPVDEILEISFGAARRMNLLSFQVARFPCTVRAEYRSGNTWKPFTYAPHPGTARRPTRDPIPPSPIVLTIDESVPKVVDRAGDVDQHPQHYGENHWQRETWYTAPVQTDRIRFVLRRNPNGDEPVTPGNMATDYSLALAEIQVGYRILTEGDIPARPRSTDTFENISDLVGSQVAVSTYRQNPEKAVDGDLGTFWQCAPQPVNYAVVPFYIDVRDENGDSQVIDKFFVDPVTQGVHCNLYYSDEHPTGSFVGEQNTVPAAMREEIGSPRYGIDSGFPLGTGEPIVLGYETGSPAAITLPDRYLRMRPEEPWWIGIDAEARESAGISEERTLLHLGDQRLFLVDNQIVLEATDTGSRVEVPVAPQHQPGVGFRITLSYHPPTFARGAYIRLRYSAPGYFYDTEMEMAREIEPGNPELTIGSSHDHSTWISVAIKALVLKYEALEPDIEEWFHDEGEGFVTDDLVYPSPRNANANAMVRMHSAWAAIDNPFGVVGGDSGRMAENIWHPINRDYTLRRGYMEFPSVRAKYWKFEFTNLTPQIYETFHTLSRDVLVFPERVVADYEATGPNETRNYAPHGTQTMVAGLSDDLTYHDALVGLRNTRFLNASPATTSVLTVKSPQLAQQVAESGWIWQYQPWHAGTGAPRWSVPSKHGYEVIPIEHKAKVGFFVGIREISAYRTDYRVTDDTDEYVDRFLDDTLIETMTGLSTSAQGVVAEGGFGTFTSRMFESYTNVRGLQFATVQTGPVQALRDPFFTEDWRTNYVEYGDASAEYDGSRLVIRRSYDPVINEEIESLTYGELEAFTYGELEGILTGDDPGEVAEYSEGGVASLGSYVPMGNGEITAKVRVSSDADLRYPIMLDIVSGRDGNGTVVASASQEVPAGNLVELSTTFAPQTLTDVNTYTWGDLEDASEIGDYPEPVDPRISGPGSIDPAQPTSVWPYSRGVWTYDSLDPATHGWRYFSLIPTQDAQISVDTFQGARVPDDPTFADQILIEVVSGLENAAYSSSNNKQRVIGDLTTGIEFIFRVRVNDLTTDDFTQGVIVRVSGYDDTALWPWSAWIPGVTDTYYSGLENYTYGQLEQRTDQIPVSELSVRVRQGGASRDTFYIHEMNLYDDPITWQFSVDDGATWHGAPGVRNNPHGVVIFPQPGHEFRWKAEISRADASISSLHIRPWYGSRGKTAEPTHDLEQEGPNDSAVDHFPSLESHPVFRLASKPVNIYDTSMFLMAGFGEGGGRTPAPGAPGAPVIEFERNLVVNPSAELSTDEWDDGFETTGGTLTQEEV